MGRSFIVPLSNFATFDAINVLSDPGHSREKLVIPNACQVTLTWSQADAKQANNVIYGIVAGAFTPTAAIADAILTGLGTGAAWTAYAAHLATTTSLTRVSLRDVRAADLPLVQSTGAPHPGTNAALALPNESAVVLTLRTAKAGRSGRGRMYMPGFSTDQVVAGNLIAPGLITDLSAWTAIISGALSGSDLQWALGLPHRIGYTSSQGTVHADRPATALPITSALVRDNHWDSQRRRGLK